MTDAPASDVHFWNRMTTLYQREGLAKACLDLQDRHGMDVVLLLFLRLLDGDGIVLSANERAAAEDRVRAWHREVVRPLRAVRRFEKPLAGDAAVAAHRDRVKELELDAERIELGLLVRWLSESGAGRKTTGVADNARRLLQESGIEEAAIDRFLAFSG